MCSPLGSPFIYMFEPSVVKAVSDCHGNDEVHNEERCRCANGARPCRALVGGIELCVRAAA